MKGIFISFEGTEGCGKSTQIELLIKKFEGAGHNVRRVREPGGTPLGEEVRRLLKHSPAGEGMCAEAELLLFEASRSELVRKVIVPSLESGESIIADRFFDSTTVYQGVARGLPVEVIHRLNHLATGGLSPQLTVLLDLDVAGSRARTAGRGQGTDRFERERDEFFEKVRTGYLDLAKCEPERFLVLDATLEAEKIHAAIVAHINQKFHGILA